MPLNAFLSQNNSANLVLGIKEWNQLTELECLLLPFAEATDQTRLQYRSNAGGKGWLKLKTQFHKVKALKTTYKYRCGRFRGNKC